MQIEGGIELTRLGLTRHNKLNIGTKNIDTYNFLGGRTHAPPT